VALLLRVRLGVLQGTLGPRDSPPDVSILRVYVDPRLCKLMTFLIATHYVSLILGGNQHDRYAAHANHVPF
jgi:hypothetical protein